MSQGLGTAQRRLLVALYCAEKFEGLWWKLADHPALDSESGSGPWFAVSQFHLVEADHTKRFKYAAKRAMALRDREFRRSRRVPYRRALRTLEQRGLAEAGLVPVDLELLGQWAWRPRGQPPAAREVWFARLTEQGRDWVRTNAIDQVQATGTEMVGAAEQFDPDERWRLQETQRLARRQRRPAAVKVPGVVTTTRVEALSKSEVVDLLDREGFAVDQVKAVLREWHREEQRQHRKEFLQLGPPLEECVFGSAELDDIRQRLAGPT